MLLESIVSMLDQLNLFLSSSDDALRDVKQKVSSFRATVYPELLGAVLFVIFNFSSLKNVPQLYGKLVSEDPIPKWRAGRVTDELIEQARFVIFLVLLYLFYTVVQIPLTFGPTEVNSVTFLGDAAIQLLLIGTIVLRYRAIRNALRRKAKTENQAERASTWLKSKFDGMNISLSKMRNQAARIFLASFSLVLMQMGPEISAVLQSLLGGLSVALHS
jgi:hypothetical protein